MANKVYDYVYMLKNFICSENFYGPGYFCKMWYAKVTVQQFKLQTFVTYYTSKFSNAYYKGSRLDHTI